MVVSDFVAGDLNPTGDLNPLAGVITFSGAVGNFILNVSTGVTKPVLGSAGAPHLALNSVDVTTIAGSLTISFTDTGFTTLAPLGLIPGGADGTRDEVRPYLDGILESTIKDEAEPWALVSAVAALVRSAAGTRSPSKAAALFLFHLYHQLAVELQGRVTGPMLTTAARLDVAHWLIEGRRCLGHASRAPIGTAG